MVLINRMANELQILKKTKEKKEINSFGNAVQNSGVIVVKIKQKRESAVTKSDVKEKIGKEGAFSINCSEVNTKDKIKQTVDYEMGSKYIDIEVKKTPKLEFIDGENQGINASLKIQNVLDKQKGNHDKGKIILNVDLKFTERNCKFFNK